MTESPLKKKIKQAFIENDHLQKKLGIALDKFCKSIVKLCEVCEETR